MKKTRTNTHFEARIAGERVVAGTSEFFFFFGWLSFGHGALDNWSSPPGRAFSDQGAASVPGEKCIYARQNRQCGARSPRRREGGTVEVGVNTH